jgi:hypothetical protein
MHDSQRLPPRPRIMTRPLPGVRLPEALDDELLAYCRAKTCTVSDAVRSGLRLLLSGETAK